MRFREKADSVLKRAANRERFYSILVKLFAVAHDKGLRLIVENPWSEDTYLKSNFILPPTLVDEDRSLRGDYYKKPTAYWFLNCQHTDGFTLQQDKKVKRIEDGKKGKAAGICSEERSMISPDYARNFICDFILGKSQPEIDPQLF